MKRLFFVFLPPQTAKVMDRLFKLLIIKTKAAVLSFALAALLLSANNLNAQNDGNRGLFGRGVTSDNAESNNRDGGVGLGGAENENPTPVGSGIAILTAIGAGYALLKRKEDKQ